jgi:hypothetical protein
MENFLPPGYAAPQGGSTAYLKLEAGTTRFRIISNPIVGSVSWTDTPDGGRKPRRTPLGAQNPGADARPFWAMAVLHNDQVKILEITQKTLMQSIQSLSSSPDWGHPSRYDVIVTRTGTSKEQTKYSLVPAPVKSLTPEQIAIVNKTSLSLELLFSGGDPMSQGGTKLIAYDGLPF